MSSSFHCANLHVGHIGCEVKKSASGYGNWRLNIRHHQFVAVMSSTLSALLQSTHLSSEYQAGATMLGVFVQGYEFPGENNT